MRGGLVTLLLLLPPVERCPPLFRPPPPARRQDPQLSSSAARYLFITAPALWCGGMFESGKRYLVAQGVVRPPSVITLIALGLSPLYCWALIFKLDLGLDGAALSVVAIQVSADPAVCAVLLTC